MPEPRSVIDGDWQTTCTAGSPEFLGHQVFLSFRRTREIDRKSVFYHDSLCQEPGLVEQLQGSYALSVSPAEEEYKIDLEFDRVEAVALTEKAQNQLQSERYCGLSQWIIGRPQDIARLTGYGCRSLGVLPIRNWNRVEVDPGQRLRFAAEIEHDNIRPMKVINDADTLRFAVKKEDKDI